MGGNTLISGDRRITLDALMDNARRAASGFHDLGVGDGDTVALFLRNDFALFEAAYAATLVGAYAVPINWHLKAAEAGYILHDCAARVLVIHADLLPAIAALWTIAWLSISMWETKTVQTWLKRDKKSQADMVDSSSPLPHVEDDD